MVSMDKRNEVLSSFHALSEEKGCSVGCGGGAPNRKAGYYLYGRSLIEGNEKINGSIFMSNNKKRKFAEFGFKTGRKKGRIPTMLTRSCKKRGKREAGN